MAQQTINIGTVPNDGTGDPIRTAFDKANDNFTELYAGLVGLLDFKGSQDCSANPNYPAASKGDFYLVSVAGKIGGASGVVVSAGDTYFATADNAGGTQASVGTSWTVIQGNVAYTPVNLAGDTMTGDLIVPDEAYDATAWNGSLEVPTKNAVRDKIETIVAAGGYTPGGTDVALADGGTGASLSDPNADRILFWDDSAGAMTWLTPGTGLTITGTTIDAAAGGDLGVLNLQHQRAVSTEGGAFTAGSWHSRALNTEVLNTISGASHVGSTVTMTIASPGVISWTAHGLTAGAAVVFSTTGALPTGLTAGLPYYVLAPNTNDFTVAATPGGAAINTTGSQSGTHTAKASRFILPAGTYDVFARAPGFRCGGHSAKLANISDSTDTLIGSASYADQSVDGDQTDSIIQGRFTIAAQKTFDIQHQCQTTAATNGLGAGNALSWLAPVFAGIFIHRVA